MIENAGSEKEEIEREGKQNTYNNRYCTLGGRRRTKKGGKTKS